jgi:hypothetical protein
MAESASGEQGASLENRAHVRIEGAEAALVPPTHDVGSYANHVQGSPSKWQAPDTHAASSADTLSCKLSPISWPPGDSSSSSDRFACGDKIVAIFCLAREADLLWELWSLALRRTVTG